MAAQNYSNASVLLRNQTARTVVNPIDRATDFFDLLMMSGRLKGGVEPFKHALVTSANSTAERFIEDQGLPDGARRSASEVALAAFYWREVVKLTGRVVDINAGGGFIDDLLAGEVENATANMLYAVEGDLIGSTANLGLISLIDDTDSYGGLNPASITIHTSLVSTTVGTLNATKVEDHWEAMQTAPYHCKPTHILLATNQKTNYGRIMGPSATSTPTRLILGNGGGYDIGMQALPMTYNGVPLVGIQNLSTQDILFFDINDYVMWVQRDVAYKPLGTRNDNTEGFVSMAGAPELFDRRRHSKMEGVTA